MSRPLGGLLRSVPALLAALAFAGAAAADDVTVTLLHVNDVYQAAPLGGGKAAGIARLATLKKRHAGANPHTLLVLGGDTISPSVASNLMRGAQMIAAWNAAALDLAVYGNHEFDFGPDVLAERVKESAFPWLAANVVDRRTGQPLAGARRYVVRAFSGVKVGFIGLVTPASHAISSPGQDAVFLDPIETARKLVRDLNDGGVHTIVALTHQSLAEDKALAREIGPDLILGGHEHAQLYSLAGRTPIFKVGSDARFAGRIDLHVAREGGRLRSLDWEILPVGESIPDDPGTAAVIAEYDRRLDAALNEPLGVTRSELDARHGPNRTGETNVANLVADAFRAHAKADVALVNGGSIRSDSTYGPGPLTRRDIVAILPFENPVVKVEVPGRVLRAALEHGLARIAEDHADGRFPQVSGLRYRFDARRPGGSRLVAVTVAGEPLDDGRVYTLATSTYVLRGGDGYAMFKGMKSLVSEEEARIAAAVVMDYLRGGDITATTDGRISRHGP